MHQLFSLLPYGSSPSFVEFLLQEILNNFKSKSNTSCHGAVGWCFSKIIRIGNFSETEIIYFPSGRWAHLAKEKLVIHDDPQSMVWHSPFSFPFCCVLLLSHFFWLIANNQESMSWICWTYSQGTRERTEAVWQWFEDQNKKKSFWKMKTIILALAVSWCLDSLLMTLATNFVKCFQNTSANLRQAVAVDEGI